ncbi:GNAT family N-acetyltransferase [Paenibacillus sp. CGMCC 1.16610]|uniref:GNAT family N-acetyltransferase n=1 Tax=Paenibacillus anseongense TaxID=2682845 RepID=A0ABW9UAY7_9BACL|nr:MULTISPECIES: GNAT family N-acetyltransferase [Paenibacillus]MBA2938041.1 GNAT family N-acetyltransferase [Paenibacillus sp. CGMCC 1.16610]MVQ37098.1 GNAT family N-acetyltransferase [Paenibacillus anseongense]
MQLVCKTDRMSLVRLDPTSSELVLDYVNRNRAFLKEWEIERNEQYYTNSYQADLLEKEVKLIEDGLLLKVWMLYEDRVIGSISLSNIVRGAFQSCHLGYRMDGSLVNRGLMTEGVQAMIDYAFEVVGLHRIEANIMPRNAASLMVVKKLGFYEEGLAFKYLKIHGVWEDHIHMVLRNTAME